MTKRAKGKKTPVSPRKQGPSRKKSKWDYTADALAAALRDVEQEGRSMRSIARSHGVPFNTLFRHARGKATSTTTGRKPYLSVKAEDKIAERVLLWAESDQALKVRQLKEFVLRIAAELLPGSHMVGCWEKKGVSAKWILAFLKRHPSISLEVDESDSAEEKLALDNKLLCRRMP